MPRHQHQPLLVTPRIQTPRRPPRPDRAFAALGLLLVLTGITAGAIFLMPDDMKIVIQDRREAELESHRQIIDAFHQSVRRTLSIPGTTNWSTSIAAVDSMNRGWIESSYPDFGADTSVQRILVVDAGLGTSTLPYTQTSAGLTGSQTNLLGPNARMLLVSNTRRGLSLPITNGPLATASFDTLWNWDYDPATKSPPSGWPSSWNTHAKHLHVSRIDLRPLFHSVSLKNVRYGLGSGSVTAGSVTATIDTLVSKTLNLLDGTLLYVCKTNGTPYLALDVSKNLEFDLTPVPSLGTPLLYYSFAETYGTFTDNAGSLGSAWDGTMLGSGTLGAGGVIGSLIPGYPSANTAAAFNGVSSYIETGEKLPTSLPRFTFACWIKPGTSYASRQIIAGVYGAMSFAIRRRCGVTYVEFESKKGGMVRARYPYSFGTWHHIAVSGDGNKLRLYLDGTPAASQTKCVSNYYYDSRRTFRIGGTISESTCWTWSYWTWMFGGLYSGAAGYFLGSVDALVLFDKVLEPSQITSLYSGAYF